MPERDDDELAGVERLIAAAQGGRGRSPLYRYYWRHFDRLAPALADRPDWAAVAATANELGLSAKGGRPITADAARQTFAKVRRERGAPAGAARPGRKGAAAAAGTAPAAAAGQDVDTPPAADAGRGGEDGPVFAPARLRRPKEG